MKILVNIVPSKYRKYALYAPFALVGLVIGVAALISDASWVADAAKVYTFVGGALGLTAYANTDGSEPPSE